ncbi:hypothetical protein ScPMuIL_016206 [Solemya velum]
MQRCEHVLTVQFEQIQIVIFISEQTSAELRKVGYQQNQRYPSLTHTESQGQKSDKQPSVYTIHKRADGKDEIVREELSSNEHIEAMMDLKTEYTNVRRQLIGTNYRSEHTFSGKQRHKRSSEEDYNIEALVLVDFSIYERWLNKSKQKTFKKRDQEAKTLIRQYFSHVINGINLRFSNLSDSGINVIITLSGIVIASNPAESWWTNDFTTPGPDSRDLLPVDKVFRSVVWWREIAQNIPEHDHVFVFTGHDLYAGHQDTRTAGYGYIGSMCKPQSVSVVEEHGAFTGIGIAAHELGHSLGAQHDGFPNICDSDEQFIMAAAYGNNRTENNKYNFWTFSNCSLIPMFQKGFLSESKQEVPEKPVYKNMVRTTGTSRLTDNPPTRKSSPRVIVNSPTSKSSPRVTDNLPTSKSSPPVTDNLPTSKSSPPVTDNPPTNQSSPPVTDNLPTSKSSPPVTDNLPTSKSSPPVTDNPPTSKSSLRVTDNSPTSTSSPRVTDNYPTGKTLKQIGSRNCLKDDARTYNEHEYRHHLNTQPGQVYGPNEQCRQLMGPSSFYGWSETLGFLDSICTNMACSVPNDTRRFRIHHAARGTTCGNKKWCINGRCTWSKSAPKVDDKCPHGDSGRLFGANMTCSQYITQRPYLCYTKFYQSQCCDTCKQMETGIKGCEYGDRTAECHSITTGNQSSLCYANADLCCSTCRQLETGVKGCEYGDKRPNCFQYWCGLSENEEYENICCDTCADDTLASASNTTLTLTVSIPSSQNANNESVGENSTMSQNTTKCFVKENNFYSVSCEYVRGVFGENVCSLDVISDSECCQPCNTTNTTRDKQECTDEPDCRVDNPWQCYDEDLRDKCCSTCKSHYSDIPGDQIYSTCHVDQYNVVDK